MTWPERVHTLPDGRQLRATYDGEPPGWVVHLVGHEDRSVSARDIHDALTELLEPGASGVAPWFMEAAEDLAARETPWQARPLSALRLPDADEAPTGTYDICNVCFWEDDGVQFHDLDYEGGANKVSLNQARENFREHGVSEDRSRTRPPAAPARTALARSSRLEPAESSATWMHRVIIPPSLPRSEGLHEARHTFGRARHEAIMGHASVTSASTATAT